MKKFIVFRILAGAGVLPFLVTVLYARPMKLNMKTLFPLQDTLRWDGEDRHLYSLLQKKQGQKRACPELQDNRMRKLRIDRRGCLVEIRPPSKKKNTVVKNRQRAKTQSPRSIGRSEHLE